jgi:uncharacterized membrane protein HdeD (DUF308 family)
MTLESEDVNVGQLADRWWGLVIRGMAAILFGVLTFAFPGLSLLALVMVWAAYTLVDGVCNLILAARGPQADRRWGWLLFEGIASIAAGVLAVVWPDITSMALLMVIAIWAVLTGFAELAVAGRLRETLHDEWVLSASGVLAIAFGVFLLMFPGPGVLAALWTIGAYAIVSGVLLVGLGWQLHGWRRDSEHPGTHGGLPTRA